MNANVLQQRKGTWNFGFFETYASSFWDTYTLQMLIILYTFPFRFIDGALR